MPGVFCRTCGTLKSRTCLPGAASAMMFIALAASIGEPPPACAIGERLGWGEEEGHANLLLILLALRKWRN